MNLFDGVLESVDGGAQLRTSFATYRLPPRLSDGLLQQPAGATPVVCGIRAEDVVVGAGSGAAVEAVEGVNDLVEPLGSDVYASLALGTDMLLARASPDLGLQEGAKVSVALNLTRLHLFDDGEGNNLALPPVK